LTQPILKRASEHATLDFKEESNLPLLSTNRPGIPVPSGIGVWMADENPSAVGQVWVIVTREALAQLDPNELPDRHLAVFNKNRLKIEAAASKKFDQSGTDPDDGEQEGRPVLIIRSDDLE
jgi:Protein of unknown function (DUF1488)